MTTRLTQKHLLRGILDLEIVGSELEIRRKSPFRPVVRSSIPLNVLDPAPLSGPRVLSFVSRGSGQALVSLAVGRPDERTFNEFVSELEARVSAAIGAVPGRTADGQAAVPDGNLHDAPPELADDHEAIAIRIRHEVQPDELEQAIRMLKAHLNDAAVDPFIHALEDLRTAPGDEARLAEVARLFAGLGIGQGAVLTYAPYLGFLLSDHPFPD